MSSITINNSCKVQKTPIYGSMIPLIIILCLLGNYVRDRYNCLNLFLKVKSDDELHKSPDETITLIKLLSIIDNYSTKIAYFLKKY